MKNKNGPAATAMAAALALAAAPAAAEDGLTLSTGFDYSRGKYGGRILTETTYIPFTAKYERGSWLYKLTVPWLRISGPGTVVGGGGEGVVLPGGAARRGSASGQGDVVASVGHTLVESTENGFVLDLVGKIKFGTADASRGLGTGKNDYALQADAVKSHGRFSALGTLGYKKMGDPSGLDLRNVWYGSVGAAWKFSPTTSAGAMLDFKQPSVAGGNRQRELTFYAAYRLGSAMRLQGYLVKGLADGSPDLGVGASLSALF